jgi:glycine betaine/proline transport system substrate-binding protein
MRPRLNALRERFGFAALAVSLVLSATTGALADDLPGKGIMVKPIVQQGLTEELFQTDLVGMGLEQLGYKVEEPVVAAMQAAFVAVSNGDATYYAAFWDPLHKAFQEKLGGQDKLPMVGTLVTNSIQGYLIDKKTADQYHLKTIDQLKDPKIAALFDVDGSGKAGLYGCQSGWGCERVIEHHLDAYGLRGTVHHIQGDYVAIISDAIERIRAGKPTLYYTWTPLWLSGVLVPGKDVVWLNVPYTALPDEQKDAVTTVPGLGNLGFSVNTQHIVADPAFLEKNPAAKKLFELMTIPIEDINAENLQIHKGENTEADVRRHAADWIAAHQAEWNDWIAQAKKAGGGA